MEKVEGTYRLHFTTLPENALSGTHINDGTVQAAAGLFNGTHHQKHTRFAGNTLECLTRAVTGWQFVISLEDPCIAAASTGIAHDVTEIDGTLKVLQERFAAVGIVGTESASKINTARVAAA